MKNLHNIKIIEADYVDMRLDRYLMKIYQDISYVQWAKLCRKGSVRINGKRVKGNENLKVGDEVRVPPEKVLNSLTSSRPKEKKAPIPTKKDIDAFADMILYEDTNIICINKPTDFASQGGTGIKKSVDASAKSWGLENDVDLKIIHRLDRDTSGILVLAKGNHAAKTLSEAFRNRTMKKFYVAILKGTPHPLQGTVSAPLSKGEDSEREKVLVSEDGKKAVTDFDIIHYFGKKASIALLQPQTGRTHQLRVHMSYLKTPIIGDHKYGEEDALDCKTLCLHAVFIRGPKINKIPFCPLPPHMVKLLDELGFSQKEVEKLIAAKIAEILGS